MEAVYADPKRTIQQRTHTFYRLEKITIQHADQKFLKLLEEGGAQVIHVLNLKSIHQQICFFYFIIVSFYFMIFFSFQKENGMTSSNKTSTDTTTSSSKSSGGGYYTNDFKSSKTGSNSDKASTKTVSFIFQKNDF